MGTKYEIPDENWTKLCEKIERLRRRAEKINVKAPALTELRFFEKPLENKGKIVGYQAFHEVEIESVPVGVEGWDFIAYIDMGDSEVGLVINQVPGALNEGEALPERFRNTNEFCEHCQVMRKRNSVYILRNQSNKNEFKQVGGNCLGQFLGGVDPQQVLSMMTIIWDFHSFVSSCCGGGSAYNYSLRDVLFITKNVINTVGWCSRKNSDIGRPSSASITAAFIFLRI